ncbi:signal peptide peptidase SppA [Devosia albogilva]|uniref:Signal peptide peptidase SppA n=1 Tax=Devosia albogilva TaxID=429726 RepID=A0ABW5QJN4_9HYPH
MTDASVPPVPPSDPHSAIAAESYRTSRGRWRLVAFLALALVVLVALGRFAMPETGLDDHIARVDIDGTIATDPARLEMLETLAEEGRVKAVIIAINSPGGTMAGGEELYEAVTRLRAAKPTVAVVKELGASAAYMTAIATDRIFTRRLSIVGSIGVLFQHVNAGKLLDTIGIDLDKVASGPLKAEPDYDEPLTGEVRASIQALVNDSFEWFVDVVAERRGLGRNTVLDLADGRIVTGRVGLELGLVDALGGEAEALEWLEAEREVAADLPIVTAWPPPQQGFDWVGAVLGAQVRAALGLPASGPVALDGLVALWQVDQAP